MCGNAGHLRALMTGKMRSFQRTGGNPRIASELQAAAARVLPRLGFRPRMSAGTHPSSWRGPLEAGPIEGRQTWRNCNGNVEH